MSLGCPESYVSIEPFLSVPGTLSPSLTYLQFESCSFPDLSVFTASTRSSLSSIDFLHLQRCQFPNNHANPVGYVCMWIANMPRLQTLLLDRCPNTDNSNHGGSSIEHAVRPNAELKRL